MKTLLYIGVGERQWWTRDRSGWHLLDAPPSSHHPVWVVTDLPEESFSEIEIPRLFGADRAALIRRQLAARFPDTSYRAVLPPKRGTGLKDMLGTSRQTFVGVSNPLRIDAELDALAVPIAGIWPLSLLLAVFCANRQLPPNLLAVHARPEALRMVFLKNHRPVLTRLVPVNPGSEAQREEIARTVRYLENTRLIERDAGQQPLLLLDGDTAAFPGGVTPVAPPSPWSRKPPEDWRLPLFDIALQSPPGQVAPMDRRVTYLNGRLRRGVVVAVILFGIAAALATAVNIRSIFDVAVQKTQVEASNHETDQRIAEIERRIQHYGVKPEVVRHAIELDRREIASVPTFGEHLRHVAAAIDRSSGLRVTQLDWRVLAAGASGCAKEAQSPPPTTPEGEAAATPASGHGIELTFETRLPEQLGPRDRSETLRRFSAALQRIPSARLVKDPVKEMTQGALQGGGVETSKNHVWCLSFPGGATAPKTPVEGGAS